MNGQPLCKHAELWGLNDGTLPRGVLVFPFSSDQQPGLLMGKSHEHARALEELLRRGRFDENGRVWLEGGDR